MPTIIITGIGGLIGSTAAEYFHARGYHIVGVDNNLRGVLMHDQYGSTQETLDQLAKSLTRCEIHALDIRHRLPISTLLRDIRRTDVQAILHCAAQPAHEGEVREDFEINALGTLNVLDVWHHHLPQVLFIYCSTIKVYGDAPNRLGYKPHGDRLEPEDRSIWGGFSESFPVGDGMSSFFGRSKAAADAYVQEYAHQYGLPAVCLRASCITGGRHAGTEAHGMLSYLMRCALTDRPYMIYGYDGRQVRDQLHADDFVQACALMVEKHPQQLVYNIGGGRANACSMLEAIDQCGRITGQKMAIKHAPARTGDHPWWVTDTRRLQQEYPTWAPRWGLNDIYTDLYQQGYLRWAGGRAHV
jgi:CDP-paratose 2-epimerase